MPFVPEGKTDAVENSIDAEKRLALKEIAEEWHKSDKLKIPLMLKSV